VMLHKPRDIRFVFQYKNGLAQTVCPRPAAVFAAGCASRAEPLTEYFSQANKLQTFG
jgi:hypothetical protein